MCFMSSQCLNYHRMTVRQIMNFIKLLKSSDDLFVHLFLKVDIVLLINGIVKTSGLMSPKPVSSECLLHSAIGF